MLANWSNYIYKTPQLRFHFQIVNFKGRLTFERLLFEQEGHTKFHQHYTRTCVNSLLLFGYMSFSCCTLSSQKVLSDYAHGLCLAQISNYPNTYPGFSPLQTTNVTIP